MLRIVSHSSQRFRDRQEGGKLLAQALQADLDVTLARRLRSPGYPEMAMGAVAEGGGLFLNEEVVRELGVDESYINREKALQLAEITRRGELIRRVAPKVPLNGRVVIVTDDGMATSATSMAGFRAAREASLWPPGFTPKSN